MTIEEFDQIVADSIAAVPEQLRGYLDSVQVITLPNPTPAQRARVGPDLLYGLYEGYTIPQRLTGGDSGVAPSLISLFRVPLRQDFLNEAELAREIRRTLWHELAHHFGIDDDQLEAWGAY